MKKLGSSLVQPKPGRQKMLRCKKCGRVFRGAILILPPKCPECGSRSVAEDGRVRY
jgi:predicted Zn-ribbon and HTH transcriptional regulator